jgi:hypothetical protein
MKDAERTFLDVPLSHQAFSILAQAAEQEGTTPQRILREIFDDSGFGLAALQPIPERQPYVFRRFPFLPEVANRVRELAETSRQEPEFILQHLTEEALRMRSTRRVPYEKAVAGVERS